MSEIMPRKRVLSILKTEIALFSLERKTEQVKGITLVPFIWFCEL